MLVAAILGSLFNHEDIGAVKGHCEISLVWCRLRRLELTNLHDHFPHSGLRVGDHRLYGQLNLKQVPGLLLTLLQPE